MREPAGQRGQSLVEAVAAMAIAGGVLVGASALFAQAGEIIASSRSATVAAAQARAHLEDLAGRPAAALIAAGSWSAPVPQLPAGAAAASFTPLGAPGIADPPVLINVTVSFVHRGRERRMTLRTVRF